MSADDFDFRSFIDPVEAPEGFDGVFEQRQITVLTYSTNLPFERQRIEEGLHRAWLGPTTMLGVVQFLSTPSDRDVRVVLGLQGESKVRTFDFETHQAQWWAWRATIRETMAIRYSADPGGMLRFTTLGGGVRIREKGIRAFHSLALGIAEANARAMSLNPFLVGELAFEERFVRVLYSVKARPENAERYGSIEHAEFASRRFLDPECDVMVELRNMPSLPVEAFESVVTVNPPDLGEQDVRFTIRATSGALRLSLPKLEPGRPYGNDTELTRAFYDFVEYVAADIVKPEMYIDEPVDPAKADPTEALFPDRLDTAPYREFLRTNQKRESWLAALDVFSPRGHWIPHLRAMEELSAGEEIAEHLNGVVASLAAEAPRHALSALEACRQHRWPRLGALLRNHLIGRLSSLPVPLIGPAEDAVFDFGFAFDDRGWDVGPQEGALVVHGLAFPLDDLRPGTAGHGLLVAARCLHGRLMEGDPDPGLASRAAWCIREIRNRCVDQDVGDGVVALVAADAIPRTAAGYRALHPGAPPLKGDDTLDERLMEVERLPLWPSLLGESSAGGWRVRNDGDGKALDVTILGVARDGGSVSLARGEALDGPWEDDYRPKQLMVEYGRYGRRFEVEVPLVAATDAGPLFEAASRGTATANATVVVDRRRVARALHKVPAVDRPVGMSRALFAVYESFVHANLELKGRVRPVLLLGEPGVGKTTFFRLLHRMSTRAKKEPVHANGSEARDGGDPNLYRGTWYGYGPGHALPGIEAGGMAGRVEFAVGSSFFIDDFEQVGRGAQGDLLALLDGRAVQGIGRRSVKGADVRFVFATNHDIDELVAAGQLRDDLLQRIPVENRITIPPLRHRPVDALALCQAFAKTTGIKLSDPAWLALARASWPNNARQVELAVEAAARKALFRGAKAIELQDLTLPEDLVEPLSCRSPEDCKRELWAFAETLVCDEWGVEGRGSQTLMAAALDLSESEVSKTLAEWGKEVS